MAGGAIEWRSLTLPRNGCRPDRPMIYDIPVEAGGVEGPKETTMTVSWSMCVLSRARSNGTSVRHQDLNLLVTMAIHFTGFIPPWYHGRTWIRPCVEGRSCTHSFLVLQFKNCTRPSHQLMSTGQVDGSTRPDIISVRSDPQRAAEIGGQPCLDHVFIPLAHQRPSTIPHSPCRFPCPPMSFKRPGWKIYKE